MHTFKARVINGRLTLNEATDLSDGDYDLVSVDDCDFGASLPDELDCVFRPTWAAVPV